MNEYTKLIIHNYWKTFMLCHMGLVEAVFMFWLAGITTPNNSSNIGAIVIFCLLGILGMCFWIFGILGYISYKVIFTNSSIAFYKWKKQLKRIESKDVKRIIVYTITRGRSKVTEAIIIDDGTFFVFEDITYTFSQKALLNESWIVIQYTKKRLQKIKALLPNCLIEEFDTADWIN